MRSSNKSRSRNKNSNNNNRRGNPTNVVNRVFDSSGPEGRVRGTPQQIIDKYQGLAHDSQLSGDRVNAENFLQHSEHYSRLLIEAQREMNQRREAQEAQRAQQQQNQQNKQQQQPKPQNKQQHQPKPQNQDQPDIKGTASEVFVGGDVATGLVETPESKPVTPAPKPKSETKPAPVKAVKDVIDPPATTQEETAKTAE